jgi:hypothetical protein
MDEKFEYHCPRCKSKQLLIYNEIIECPYCKLTFTKRFLKNLQDDSILAEEEKTDFVRSLKNEKI